MKRIFLSIIILMTSTLSYAKPAYLECNVLSDENVKKQFFITLNEETGEITHESGEGGIYYPKGSVFVIKGIFTTNDITYKKLIDKGTLTNTFYRVDINRNNLNVHEMLYVESRRNYDGKIWPKKYVIDNKGTCKLTSIKDRKI